MKSIKFVCSVDYMQTCQHVQVDLSGEPQGALAEGQLVCCRVRLSNTGAMPLQELRVAAMSQDTLLTPPCAAVDDDPVAHLASARLPVFLC